MDSWERAHKLVITFLKQDMVYGKAKQCATYLCKEVIREIDMHHIKTFDTLLRKEYWSDVIKEIDKM
jgi:hypothetical protein